MLAMDVPGSVAPHVADLVPVLDDVRGDRVRTAATDLDSLREFHPE
jgi:hypothetical protein